MPTSIVPITTIKDAWELHEDHGDNVNLIAGETDIPFLTAAHRAARSNQSGPHNPRVSAAQQPGQASIAGGAGLEAALLYACTRPEELKLTGRQLPVRARRGPRVAIQPLTAREIAQERVR